MIKGKNCVSLGYFENDGRPMSHLNGVLYVQSMEDPALLWIRLNIVRPCCVVRNTLLLGNDPIVPTQRN